MEQAKNRTAFGLVWVNANIFFEIQLVMTVLVVQE